MTQKQHKQLQEDWEHKVCFVWSWWISIDMSYETALDFIKTEIREEEHRTAMNLSSLEREPSKIINNYQR